MEIMKLSIDCFGIIIQVYLFNMFFHALWVRWVEHKIFCLCITLVCTILLLANSLFSQNGMIITDFLVILSLTLLYRSSIRSKIIFSALTFTVFAVSEILVGILLSIVSDATVRDITNNISMYLVGAILSKFVTFTLVKILILLLDKGTRGFHGKLSIGVQIIPPACFILSVVLYILLIDERNSRISGYALLVIVGMATFTIFICSLIRAQSELEDLEQLLVWARMHLKEQAKHYEEIQRTQEDIRIMRHDQKDFIIGLGGLLKKGDVKAANEKIWERVGALSEPKGIVDTGMPALDAVLYAKIKRAKKVGIEIKSKILLDREVLIDQMDMSLVIANALENAIEATEKLPLSRRRIHIRLKSKSGYVVISVVNPVEAKPILKTSKLDRENHGLGLISIQKIANQYDGNIHIVANEDFFSISVMLRNNERKTN